MTVTPNPSNDTQSVRIRAAGVTLDGDLTVPAGAAGIVVFAHGSGSSRSSPRNRRVAGQLQQAGFGTLLFDLLTPQEETIDAAPRELRFDIPLLAERLAGATDWLASQPAFQSLPIGYFGASTGAAAALVAAALRPQVVQAVVSRGGRPDLAGPYLPRVKAPTLLIVGGYDTPVIGMNRAALAQLQVDAKELLIVPRATHLFEEPGALEQVAELAVGWFQRHVGAGVC
jgi:putative phosphoribosyl transferase